MSDTPSPETRAPDHAQRPDAPEIVYVNERHVACSGNGGALGHPRVWYSLQNGEAECGYCDRRFVFDPARVVQGNGSGAL